MNIGIVRNRISGSILRLSPKAQEIFIGSFWSISGAIISKGLLFISWVLVARILGTKGYGQFGIIRSTISMFTTFAGFSLGITASKFLSELKTSNIVRSGRILGLTISFGIISGAVIGIVFFCLSPWLATKTLNEPFLTTGLQIGSLILFFSAINGAQIGALQGFQAFKKIAKINAYQAFASFPFFILGALYGGVNGSLWAFALSTVFICLLSHFSIKDESRKNGITIDYIDGWKEKSLLLTYSFPSLLSGLIVSLMKWVTDSILVKKAGFEQMGIIAATLTFQNLIIMGANMLDAPFLTVMSKNKGYDKDSFFSKMNIVIPWVIGVVIGLPFIAFPEIGAIVFGRDFSGKDFNWTFIIVSFFTIIMLFKQGLARVIAVYDLQWWGTLSNLIWGGSLLCSFLLMKTQNSFSLALSYLIAYLISTISIMPLYFKKNLIPNDTIISKQALFIWGLILATIIIGLFVQNIPLRVLILSVVVILIYILFKGIVTIKS